MITAICSIIVFIISLVIMGYKNQKINKLIESANTKVFEPEKNCLFSDNENISNQRKDYIFDLNEQKDKNITYLIVLSIILQAINMAPIAIVFILIVLPIVFVIIISIMVLFYRLGQYLYNFFSS